MERPAARTGNVWGCQYVKNCITTFSAGEKNCRSARSLNAMDIIFRIPLPVLGGWVDGWEGVRASALGGIPTLHVEDCKGNGGDLSAGERVGDKSRPDHK